MKKIILCGHDISEYTVITAADPDNITKKAASEFVRYIKAASGADLEISADTSPARLLMCDKEVIEV